MVRFWCSGSVSHQKAQKKSGTEMIMRKPMGFSCCLES